MNDDSSATNGSATRSGIPATKWLARNIAAVVLGNALEFYDFLTFSFFAVYIGRAFFPSASASTSLLATLATFGAGFLTRPIGALIIGRMGDRRGRKPAMVLSFWLMGIAIVGLALTPPRAMIGIAAPILVLCFRLLQGFALGGEVGPTTAFLVELAPPHRRGFYAAFQGWSQDCAVLVAGLVGFSLANLLSERQLENFGWRIAMLAGAVVIPLGLAIRRGLPETLHAERSAQPITTPLRPYLSIILIGLALLAYGTIGTYSGNFATTYAISTLHLKASVSFAGTIVVGLTGVVFGLFTGALSDRIGRKPVMMVPGVLLLCSILPAFHLILRYRTAFAFLAAYGVLSTLRAMSIGSIITWLTESLPPAFRSGGVALIYAVSISVFGGSTQFVLAWLIKTTGSPLAPAYYWTGATLIGLLAMLAARESAPAKLALTTKLSS
jgi:MFS family permease